MDPIKIYEDLKEKIVWLKLSPGSTLNQVELSETFGVSRNPLTIALTRLDAEGWVVRNGSHFVVSPLTIDRMREITEIRSVLEIQANLWAMNRITPDGIKELKELGNEIKLASPAPTRTEIVRLDFRFHSILYRETRNRELVQLLERLLSHYLRFWLAGPQEIKKDAFFADTLQIIHAVESKDELSLRASTAVHIKSSLDFLLGIS
jgi:DNA-binding GntR family transcriptional regulator